MKKAIGIFVFLLCAWNAADAEVRIAQSLKPIEQEMSCSEENTLVLLDIGGTLVSFRDAAMHKAHQLWRMEWFDRNCPGLTREQHLEYVCIVESALENWCLTDPDWPNVVATAQEKGFKTVAFTKVMMDPSLHGLRSTKLKSHGILLNDDLCELTVGKAYEYSDGVIETGARLKGPVLIEVLSHLSEKPEKIIFVDDKFEHIESVDQVCAEAGIACTAFHYIPTEEEPLLNEVVFDFQFRTLVNERRWISEKEALELLEQSN